MRWLQLEAKSVGASDSGAVWYFDTFSGSRGSCFLGEPYTRFQNLLLANCENCRFGLVVVEVALTVLFLEARLLDGFFGLLDLLLRGFFLLLFRFFGALSLVPVVPLELTSPCPCRG